MKVKMKKLVMVLLCVSVWAMNFAALGKCESQPILETEDFTYEISGGGKVEKFVAITGLTEKGKEKEVLIVPHTIDGYPVTLQYITIFYNYSVWESDKLTTLYLFDNVTVYTEFHCPKLRKTFIINLDLEDRLQNSNISDKVIATYVHSENFFSWNIKDPQYRFPANITYNYNYVNSPNNGCYWLDNLSDGEKITYIPNEPTREGYKFGGWYHEPECITAWDFENDTITAYEYEEYTQETFYENVLYAKWL